MAVVQNPLIHRASGSVGNSVFSKWKTKNTLRSKSILPYPSPSPSQTLQRNKFKNCSTFFLPLKFISSLMFLSASTYLSALNSFVKQNISLFASDSSVIAYSNISSLQFSSGTIESFFQVSVSNTAYLQCAVGGSYLFDYSISDADVKTIVIVVDDTNKDCLFFESNYDSSQSVICNFEASRYNHDLYFFCFQYDRKKKKSSNSQYISMLNLN